MATWQNTLVLMVRNLINDYGAVQTYEDEKIEEAIVMGGLYSTLVYSFSYTYEFDLENRTISPDPVAVGDTSAMALFSLKAACMFDTNKYQHAVGTGIKVRDGDSSVDLTSGFGGYKDILTLGPCASFQKLLLELSRNQAMSSGKAVVGAASHPDFGWGGVQWLGQFFDSFGDTRFKGPLV